MKTGTEVCPLCAGSGWKPVPGTPERGVTRCNCQMQARGSAMIAAARIPKRYEHCELSNFTIDFPGADRSVSLAQISASRFVQEFDPRDGKGLLLVGPTQLYGYTAAGDAAPEAETRYIEQVRQQFYAPLSGMTVPLSSANFERYGCSTTPTLVLLDGNGIVRLYHPGAMTFEALSEQIQRTLTTSRAAPQSSSHH